MIQYNYCGNVYEAQKLFVDILNEQGPQMILNHAEMPSVWLYRTMPDVFAQRFHAFIGELLARDLAPHPQALRWSLWDTAPAKEWPNYPDYNQVMRGAELNNQRRASLFYAH